MKKFIAFAAAAAAISAAVPATAADFFLFGYGPDGTQTLTLNGGSTIGATEQQGWFHENGSHVGGNTNYLTALAPSYGYAESRSFFTFDVANGVTSAYVSLGNNPGLGFLSTTGQALTLTLYDVSSFIDGSSDYAVGDAAGLAIFNDLGTGTVYGSVTVTGPTSLVVVNFNAAGLAAINAAGDTGSSFTFGGRLTVGSVPEPASWALMIAGFGMVGFAMRRRATVVTA